MKKTILIMLLLMPFTVLADNDDGCKVYLCLSSTGGGEECTTRIAALAVALYVGGARLPTCTGHDGLTIMDGTDGKKLEEAYIHLDAECCPDTYCADQSYTLTSPRGLYSGECP